MSILSPTTWIPWTPWLGIGWLSWDALSTGLKSPHRSLLASAYLVVYLLTSFWHGQVTQHVPEPYLDEIFHIPQAQAYCSGDFHIWDPKLTTPPGLYVFATLFGNLGGIRSCNVYLLRLFNTFVLVTTMAYAMDCRKLITQAWNRESNEDKEDSKPLSPSSIHTAFNIALFPPLFFFSGLFYTDLLSTCVVLRMYRLFLERKGSLWIYLAGLLALTMRQTNIFWAAVFLGGLEAVRAVDDIRMAALDYSSEPESWKEIAISKFIRYSGGEIHDILLKDTDIQDVILCAISLAVALIAHPISTIRKLWPYVALLLSFAGFVFWNGGVVLGDKSNHVATIHLPQLLYLSAFIAFFSAPLLIPPIVSFLQSSFSFLIPSLRTSSASPTTSMWRLLLISSFWLCSLLATLATIHFNTIIHPFTLADNRHYVFYVFRYTIRLHPLIRYLLAPVYLLCAYFSYRTLSGPVSTISTTASAPPRPDFTMASLSPKPRTAEMQQRLDPTQAVRTSKKELDAGPKTSFLLIFFLSTALCLITAPLVEPRYFILPWVLWRLHVPGWSSSSSLARRGRRIRGVKGRGALLWESLSSYDYRLWLETLWFLAINAGTGYIFLYRGFEWVQEPGLVQRFMW